MLENDCGPQASQIAQIAQKKYISHEFALRHLQPTNFHFTLAADLIAMQQHQPVFSRAFWLHCRLQGLHCQKLRKQLGESFCLTPAQSAWRDSLNSIFLSPMSVSNIYPDDRCGLCPSRNESQQGLVSSQVWHDQTSFILICVPAIFTFHLPCACRLRPYQVQLFIRS